MDLHRVLLHSCLAKDSYNASYAQKDENLTGKVVEGPRRSGRPISGKPKSTIVWQAFDLFTLQRLWIFTFILPSIGGNFAGVGPRLGTIIFSFHPG